MGSRMAAEDAVWTRRRDLGTEELVDIEDNRDSLEETDIVCVEKWWLFLALALRGRGDTALLGEVRTAGVASPSHSVAWQATRRGTGMQGAAASAVADELRLRAAPSSEEDWEDSETEAARGGGGGAGTEGGAFEGSETIPDSISIAASVGDNPSWTGEGTGCGGRLGEWRTNDIQRRKIQDLGWNSCSGEPKKRRDVAQMYKQGSYEMTRTICLRLAWKSENRQ
jgi:hypothetical protein